MFHCPVGVWIIEQRAIMLSATVRSPTVYKASWLANQFQLWKDHKLVDKKTNIIDSLLLL